MSAENNLSLFLKRSILDLQLFKEAKKYCVILRALTDCGLLYLIPFNTVNHPDLQSFHCEGQTWSLTAIFVCSHRNMRHSERRIKTLQSEILCLGNRLYVSWVTPASRLHDNVDKFPGTQMLKTSWKIPKEIKWNSLVWNQLLWLPYHRVKLVRKWESKYN